MPHHDWNCTAELPPIRSYYVGDEPDAEQRAAWVEIRFPGPVGRRRAEQRERFDGVFEVGRWRSGWRFGGRVVDRVEALQMYEEAYYERLRDDAETLGWLCVTASEVYDNALTNLECGFDYAVQETPAVHLQDIALRRCLLWLGRRFAGDHPVQIRGHTTEGYRLNPGQVPFPWPQVILPYAGTAWWQPDSVEAFWQHNKVVLVAADALRLRPRVLGAEGLWCEMDERTAVLIPGAGARHLQARPTKEITTLLHVKRGERRHRLVTGAPEACYRELAAINLPAVRAGAAFSLPWGSLEQTS